jgi:hypothetical protein
LHRRGKNIVFDCYDLFEASVKVIFFSRTLDAKPAALHLFVIYKYDIEITSICVVRNLQAVLTNFGCVHAVKAVCTIYPSGVCVQLTLA